MSMIAEGIQKVLDISRKHIICEGDRKFDSATLKPILASEPKCLGIHSLQGVVDFVSFEFDEGSDPNPRPAYSCLGTSLALVVEATSVKLVSKLQGVERQRFEYLIAISQGVEQRFGKWLPAVEAVVWLQQAFVPTPARDELLAALGSIDGGTQVTTKDDGVSQSVTVKKGVTRIGEVGVKNPVVLKPYRTFSEIEQPDVACIVRVEEIGMAIKIMIEQADGGVWEIKARESIAAWLRERLPEIPIIA